MKLKNDIQAVAFLIRNRIPFSRQKHYIEINDEKAGPENVALLSQYEYNGFIPKPKQGPRPTKFNFRAKYRNKEKVFIKVIEPTPEPQPEEKKRPPANYSNPKYNS